MAMVELQAGTRRAVVRSERFMEWQRELIRGSSYGARKRQEESECVVAAKKCCVVKSGTGSDEQELKSGNNRNEERGPPDGDDKSGSGKEHQQQHQHQSKRLNGKKLRKKHDLEQKAVSSKDADGRMRRQGASSIKGQHQQPQQHHQQDEQQLTRRTQRRIQATFAVKENNYNSERNFRLLTRSRAPSPSPPELPSNKVSKRSKRVAQRLANEEPPPPPLKLPKLHLVLTRKEIQEDWMKITGHKYTGKPKKSTLIQRGFGLCTSLTCPSSIRYLNDPQ